MSIARDLLNDLATLGVSDATDDDPIARAVLGEAAAAADEAASADEAPSRRAPALPAGSARRWRGAALLRAVEPAGAASTEPAVAEGVDSEAERAVDAALEAAPANPAEPPAGDGSVTPDDDADDDAAPDGDAALLEVLLDLRRLAKKQLRVSERIAAALEAKAPAATEARASMRPRPPAPAVVVPPVVAAATDAPAGDEPSRAEQVQARMQERQERLRERAARERQQLAELTGRGMSPEDAVAEIEAAREAELEQVAASGGEDENPVFDDVPMAAGGPAEAADGVPARPGPAAAGTQSSRVDGFDVDFDVSSLGR